MKKIAPIVAFALLAIATTSCTKSKDYECVCTTNGVETTTPITTNTRALASTSCKAMESSSGSSSTSCNLK